MRQHLIAAAALVAPLLAGIPPVHAHGGEDHSAPAAGPAATAPAAANVLRPGFGADGTLFQIVLAPQSDGTTLVYLADIDSNAPVAGASLDVEAAGWQGRAEPSAAEGIYLLAWAPPAAGTDVTVMASAVGKDDLLLVAGVKPPAPPAIATRADDANHWLHWGGGGAIGLLMASAAVMLGRRGRKAAMIGLLALLVAPDAFAHSGHDHRAAEAQAPGPELGAMLAMPKATQFLLGIRTEIVAAREAADTLRVLGRVVPDPAGYARVQPSQPARVVGDPSFALPIPGQIVKRGQVIAVLEPTLSTLERSDKRMPRASITPEIDVDLRPSDRSREVILADLRGRLAQLPGISVNIGQPISHRLDHLLSGVRAEIAVKIFGDDLDTMRASAAEARSRMAAIDGIADLQVEKQVLIPQLQIRLDRAETKKYGLTLDQLTETLEATFPMALVGSVAALWLTDQTLSVASLVGFVTLTGIAARNGIMKVSHYLHLMRDEGETFGPAMVMRGSLERLTPVLMTALVAALALFPLVVAGGEPGKEILHPVAVVIFAGLVSSTLLDTLVTPILFLLLGRPAQSAESDKAAEAVR